MIPLLAEEATSEAMNSLLREDREIVVWWGTWAECTVAISRFVRINTLNENDEATARFMLGLFAIGWTEIASGKLWVEHEGGVLDPQT